MSINKILEQQGWELKEQQDWISVWDRRPAFNKISRSGRVAKLVGSNLYVVPALLAEIAETLILAQNAIPERIKSTNGVSKAVYVGFDISTVSEGQLDSFVRHLSAAINELI